MQYTTIALNNREIEVLNERQQLIGHLEYAGWSPQKAHITASDRNIYDIRPNGFWQTARIVLKNDMPYAELKPNMRGALYIHFSNGQSFLLKKKNWWGISSYILLDGDGRHLGTVETVYNWRAMSYTCTMDITNPMPYSEDNLALPLILAYGVKYLRIRM